MSMQLALGVVGGVIGSFFGMPQLGFLVGSVIGTLLTPGQHTQGPRLDDLKVTVSTYGNAIPTIYGTKRIGGNVFWATDKIELGTTQTAGKGGGSSNTSYHYYEYMAVSLGYGPIIGIRKVWQDGKLIYDVSSGIAVGSALATADNPFSSLVFYPGNETQLPDPVIEGWEGVGNVPGYRGISYVRLNAIECPAGRVPQFEFEVTTSATNVATTQSFVDVPPLAPSNNNTLAVIRKDSIWNVDSIGNWYDGTLKLKVTYCGPGSTAVQRTIPLPTASSVATPIPLSGDGDPCVLFPYDGNVLRVRLDTGDITTLVSGGPSLYSSAARQSAGYDKASNKYAMVSGAGPYPQSVLILSNGGATVGSGTIPGVDAFGNNLGACTMHNDVAYVLSQQSGHLVISSFSGEDGSLISSTTGPVYQDISSSILWSALQPGDGGLYAWARDTGPIGALLLYKLWFIDLSVATPVFTELGNNVTPIYGEKVSTYPTTIYAGKQYAIIGPGADSAGRNLHNYALWQAASLTVVPTPVAGIISDQCTKAGLSAGQIDVSTLQDTVWGYTIASVSSARNNLQPLLTAYAIDAVDEDGKVKFFKRAAITSMASVTFDELACVDGSGAPGDPMPLAHTQEAELPSSVAVSYLNPAFDYQTGTETARRSTDLSRNDQTVDLPISCSPDFAASVAQMLLYDAWNERNRRTAQVSRKWAFLSAGDGVTIEYPKGTTQLWRLSKVTDTGTLMQWELVPADATIYTQQAIGSAQRPALQVAPLAPLTHMQIIDSAILRDSDDNAGPYVAMAGYTATYPGGELFIGPDAGSLVSRGTVANEATMGFLETAPGAWGSNVVDETNLLTVNVDRFTLSSITRDVMLQGASNIAAIGANGRWEIIAFRTASSLGSGRYTLSGLLRGLRGTEWATGLHQTGDTFVMLGMAGTLRPTLDVGSIGTSQLYRAITLGRSAGTDQTYANTGEGLKPFSPVNPRKSKDTSGNITLTWDRRTRYSSNWLTGIMPLGQVSEQYDVVIYSDNTFTTIKRVYRVYAPTAVYLAADQTTDFGSLQSTVYEKIYQVSDSIGRGHELKATV